MIRFENTTAAQRIAAFPRAIYRVTVERNPLAALSFATGTLNWPRVVRDLVDNSANPAAFALGGGASAVLDSDRVATLDFQAKATAANAVTVADLVNAIERASKYARIVAVRREPPAPGYSAGGPDALDAEREARNAAEREAQRERSPLGAITGGLTFTRNVLVVAAIVAAAVAAYRLFPNTFKVKS